MKTFNPFASFSVLCLCLSLCLFFSCNIKESKIITVTGEIPAGAIGKTLHHEHLLVDFIGADSTGYHRWNKDTVIEKVLPYLLEIKKLGYKTLVECTPAYLGRDPVLLKMLSEKSGIQIITNTGYYSAVGSNSIDSNQFDSRIADCIAYESCDSYFGTEGMAVVGISDQSRCRVHNRHPAMEQSTDLWAGGMPAAFRTASYADYR